VRHLKNSREDLPPRSIPISFWLLVRSSEGLCTALRRVQRCGR
jgi:hypothetical protein